MRKSRISVKMIGKTNIGPSEVNHHIRRTRSYENVALCYTILHGERTFQRDFPGIGARDALLQISTS